MTAVPLAWQALARRGSSPVIPTADTHGVDLGDPLLGTTTQATTSRRRVSAAAASYALAVTNVALIVFAVLVDDYRDPSWLAIVHVACVGAGLLASGVANAAIIAVAVDQLVATAAVLTDVYDEIPGLVVAALLCNSVAFQCLLLSRQDSAPPTRSALDDASFLSRYTFWWAFPTLRVGRTVGKLEAGDLPRLPDSDDPTYLVNEFLRHRRRSSPTLFGSRALRLLVTITFSIQPGVFLSSYLHGIAFLACMFIDPIVLAALLSASAPMTLSYVLVGVLSVSMLVRVSCMEYCYFQSTRVANNARTALCQALFSSVIRQRVGVRDRPDTGKLANLMATDADKIGQWAWGVFFLAQWTWAVVSLPAVIYFLHRLVGTGAFVGVACLLGSAVISRFVGRRLASITRRLQERRDERSSLMRSFVASVKVTKLERLEQVWVDRLGRARDRELDELWLVNSLVAFSTLMGSLLSLTVPVAMFAWHTLIDGQTLDAAVAFSALAWISQMQWSISTLPSIYNAWSSLSPSLDRIATRLEQEHADDDHNHGVAACAAPIDVRPGLQVIVGATGSGKSTALAALAARQRTGASYSRQRPFLLNASIQENILFGLPLDRARLNDVVQRTELEADLAALPQGILTPVGPSGVQLSGGQKARVCLARAVYADAAVVLLDDVLAAVDRTTGSRIWSNVICYERLRGKSIVLVTHDLRCLTSPAVDNIILLDHGSIVASGALSALGEDFLIVNAAFISDNPDEPVSSEVEQGAPQHGFQPDDDDMLSRDEVYRFISGRLRSLTGKVIDQNLTEGRILRYLRQVDTKDGGNEEKSTGSITMADMMLYLREFGWWLAPIVSMVGVLTILSVSMNVWLAIWTSSQTSSWTQHQYLLVYVALGISDAVISCLQTLFFTRCTLRTSRSIHRQMIQRLVGAPLSYYDTNSSGMILMPYSVLDQVSKTFSIVAQFMLIVVYAPLVFLVLPVMVIIYVGIFRTVRIAARDTRRIQSVARSPVYEFFSDVIDGRDTIQCTGAEDRFERGNHDRVEKMAQGTFGNEAVMKWAQALTTQSSCMLYFAAGVVSVILISQNKMSLGAFGLVLMYAASLQRAMMDYLMGLTNVETNFVSVERIADILRMPVETDDRLLATTEQPAGWPVAGEVRLDRVAMRYTIGRPEVLKGISLTIPAGSKVAVIGRTGSGKSSMVSVLSSLYPIGRGSILIDGVHLERLPLDAARRAVRVIPQDPVLFGGSVRFNLVLGDDGADDAKLWQVLKRSRMDERVNELGGLDGTLEDAGGNLSVGERQLMCLARALAQGQLRVLLCDEPTANVDQVTGALVLQVLLEMKGVTVVMIMHRLEHLDRFDHILLLESGNVVAFGPSKEMLQDPSSPVNEFLLRYQAQQ
ncbi:hypothetical protein PBRA_004721 [Plasmodiophora brassicae]|uniref:P-loop containing nucleoside triphosphate hydrolase protein n=1 Tax=Plasmodiophora brassicae TaxID=37360 RepID=A0A0G4ILB3_PLABS|nr:hypothetical protein PBRA_004721 [Plasmodiophora brassicae]